jgi:hypothetical protein
MEDSRRQKAEGRFKDLRTKFEIIHDDINFVQFVIPGLTEPAPYLIRGNPVFYWIPTGVYPVEERGGNDTGCRH